MVQFLYLYIRGAHISTMTRRVSSLPGDLVISFVATRKYAKVSFEAKDTNSLTQLGSSLA